ncbi:lipopolysaccharide biosynthesis protein [Neptunitalea lumnitzerae]|uniref:Sugar isomerase n=1 Tax=Neptunitalea lumnitzerae TaxID=2965509 RepID=A0ABQ5MJ80_9FLAO|nr:oligosaccharide flippase family protein [Neptunitalea sp. Y10]GLB49471.1 hypothetical protein Y10_18390 [Neptunitalea sp. Y10]
MGVIFKQSLFNIIFTYLGFALGAINTLFLYPNFMSDEYYGLIGYLISVSNILAPLLNAGVQNAMVKFYSSYEEGEQQHKFNFMMFILPILMMMPIGLLMYVMYDPIASFLSRENPIIANYAWIVFVIAASMAYFEVFYAWTKVQLQSVKGNFMKEVVHRAIIMILLFALYLDYIGIENFIYLVVLMYFTRMLLMGAVAFHIKKPSFKIGIPDNFKTVFNYSLLIIVAGSIAIILLDIDKFMLGQYVDIKNVAYYNVAVFIAIVIAVPSRAMQQITTPITAKLLNANDMEDLESLYKRSSLNLYIVSGIIFLLIVLNINQLYKLLPVEYSSAIMVVFLISLAKLMDNLIGINNAIIFNSKYYKTVLTFGVFLAILTVVLNALFIPVWGMNGAGLASLMAFFIYNATKIVFVNKKFGIQPFTIKTVKTTLLFAGIGFIFFFWDFNFHPIINIVIKSGVIVVVCLLGILKLNLSSDITYLWKKYIPFAK